MWLGVARWCIHCCTNLPTWDKWALDANFAYVKRDLTNRIDGFCSRGVEDELAKLSSPTYIITRMPKRPPILESLELLEDTRKLGAASCYLVGACSGTCVA
jgi:hypothetical protein